jgi:penicillin-binding protein 1A
MALALGAREVRPIELANAYAVFASGGRWAPWHLVSRIEGTRRYAEVAAAGPRGAARRAERRGVVRRDEPPHERRRARWDRCARARDLGRPVAAKTGTSNEARDVWFAGFTPELVGVVWVGYDDQRSLGARETGGRTALADLGVRDAHRDRRSTAHRVPAARRRAHGMTVDRRTGLLPYAGQTEDTIEEVFLEGTVPTEHAPEPGMLDAASFLMQDDPAPEGEPTPETTP